MSRQQQQPTSHSRRKNVLTHTVTCVAAICWVPCVCMFATAVGCIYIYRGIVEYESPKAKEKKRRERVKKDRLRRTPKYFAYRNEGSTLTLPIPVSREGRDEKEGLVFEEGGDDEEKEQEIFQASEKAGEVKVKPKQKKIKGISPLPHSRPHHRRNEVVREKITNRQTTSFLFKLPREIRMMIYEEVLAGYVFHVYFQDAYRRLRAERCRSVKPRFWNQVSPEICKGAVCRSSLRIPGAPDYWGGVGLLPLLMSCRRVYSETIEILYSHNAFEFDSLQTLLQFTMTILPQRLPLMKAVQWKKSTFSSVTYLRAPWHDCSSQPGCGCAVCISKEVDIDYALTMYGAA